MCLITYSRSSRSLECFLRHWSAGVDMTTGHMLSEDELTVCCCSRILSHRRRLAILLVAAVDSGGVRGVNGAD